MDFINRLAEILARIGQMIEKNKRAVTALACLVVFITTYALILPAITLDEHSAADQGGIDLKTEQQADTQNDAKNEKQEVTTGDQQTDGQAAGDTEKTPQTGEQKDSSDSQASDESEKAVGGESKEGVTEKTSEEADKKDDSKTEEKKDDADKAAAQTLKYKGGDYKVTAKCGKNADIPEGAELKVKEIRKNSSDPSEQALYKKYYDKATKAIQNDTGDKDKELRFARFFDITFLDKDGKEIEPSAKVEIKIEYDKAVDLKKVDGVKAVHFDEKSGSVKTKVIDVDTTVSSNEKMSDASFKASEFSVYALVGSEKTIETSVLTAEGKTYTIKVTYDEEAGIPDGAELSAKEITSDSKNYGKYMKQTESRLNMSGQTLTSARFFDIEIQNASGEKIEPKTPVKVEISYDDAVDISKGESLKIVHFVNKGKGTELISDVDVSKDKKEISYTQDSFSVTGTIVAGKPSNGQQRMIVLKDGNRYYIVNNDASLTEVGYDEATGTVSVVEPMLWTFNGNNIYFNSEASGFNENQLASDWFRRYLNPNTATGGGTTEEVKAGTSAANNPENVGVTVTKTGEWTNTNDNNNVVEINSVTNRQTALNNTSVTIDTNNGTSTIRHGDTYLGIERDGNGTPVRLVPQTGDIPRANFVFAEASKVPSGVHLQNAVNHIDISIQGGSEVNVPLAYGTYYDADGNSINIFTNTTVTLGPAQATDPDDLKITAEDMKRATITAYDKNGNELDDAFYITGFSQNASTSLSTPQVRIEGSFKVAQPEKDNPAYKTIDGNRYDGNWWAWQMPDQNYVNAVRQARLNNIIDYRLTVIKPVKYQLVDKNGTPLYIDKKGTPLYVSVDVAFSGTFNYWDNDKNSPKNSGNECPPLENNPAWQAGDIPSHDLSGMDFVLKGTANEQDSPLCAIEVMKRIVDEKGNLITVGEPVTNHISIYENKDADRNAVKDFEIDPINGVNPERDNDEGLYEGYSHLRDREITIEPGSAQALIYDYNVTDAMYYITEHSTPQELPEKIKDTNNEEWTYVKTYIKTEYVKRGYKDGGGDSDYYNGNDPASAPMHTSGEFYRGDKYRSSPEVVGWFKPVNGDVKKSGFLEYFVYNVYTKGKILDVEKKWQPKDGKIPEGAEVTLELYYAKGENKQFPEDKDQYKKVVAGQGPFDEGLKTTVKLTADKNWADAFEDLPGTMTEGDKVYDLDYYAKEVSIKVPAAGKTEIDEDAIDITNAYKSSFTVNSGKETISNEREEVSLDAEKVWAEGTEIPAGAEVTFGLRFATRKVINADGTPVAENDISEWPDKGSYAPVKTTNGYAAPFVNDPGIDETKIDTEIKLDAKDANDQGVWVGVFNKLPKYLIDSDGSILEVDYYAEETAVKVPADGRTAVDDDAVTVTDNYISTAEKTDSDEESSDGKVTITNEQNKTSLEVHKSWGKGTDIPDGTKVKVGLKYAARMVTNKNGQKITPPADWPEKSAYKNVTHGSEDALSVEGSGDGISVTGLTVKSAVELELEANATDPTKDWGDTFSGLPKYLRDSEGNTWELDYFAVETAVNVPGDNETVENRISDYIHTEVKTEAASQDAETSDGSVKITNKEKIVVDVQKRWTPEVPEGGKATVQLKRYKVSQTPAQIKTSATVVKVWDDANNQDGKRPESVTVTLRGGDVNKPVTLNSENNWRDTVDNLQAYDTNGDPIVYTWTESLPENAEGYSLYSLTNTTTREGVTTLTNSYTPGKTSATVRIDWQDADNRDAYRPEAVVVKLDQNGQKVTLNEANNWTETISGLPEYSNGNKIDYTWTAESWTNGDNSKYDGNGKSEREGDTTQSKITYTHEADKIVKKVRIVWDDADNVDNMRPESEDVHINNEPNTFTTLSPANNWENSIELLKNENGQPISYAWTNPVINGYTCTGTETEADGTVVMTYKHEPRPPRDYVNVTVHTIKREASEGKYINWETNGWHTNIYNLTGQYHGNAVTIDSIKAEQGDPNINWNDESKTLRAPLTYRIDKNSASGFHIEVGGTDVSLVNIGANGTTLTQSGDNTGRNISFTAGEDDIDIYVVLTGYEQPLPEYSDVYMVVAYYEGDNQNPSNVVKHIRVPVNTDVSFNYNSYNNQNPSYKVLYWHDTQYHDSWEALSPKIEGDGAPDEDIVFNVGMKEKIMVFVKGDPQAASNFNCQLRSLATGNNSNSNSTNALFSTNGARSLMSIDSSDELLDSQIKMALRSGNTETKNVSDEAVKSGNDGIETTKPAASRSVAGRNTPSLIKGVLPNALRGDGTGNGDDQNGTEGGSSNVIKSSPVTVPEGYEPDTDFNNSAVTLTLNDENGWEQSFPEQEKYDRWGRPYIYYVDEIDFAPADYSTDSITGDPNAGQTVVVNNKKNVEYGSVKVTKAFGGIESLPDEFKITAAYKEGSEDKTVELTVGSKGMTGTGTSNDPYTWIIDNIPVGTEVTFEESGYNKEGYSVTVNGSATATPVKATAAKTIGKANTAAFVNAYTKNPGDLELTKKVSGKGADASKQFEFTIELTAPTDVALDDSYKYTQTGNGEQTLSLTKADANAKTGTATVNLKANDVLTIMDLPAGVTYKITEADYSLEGYTATTTQGSLEGTITGGSTAKEAVKEAVEVTNTYSVASIGIVKVDEETKERLQNATFRLTKKTDGDYVRFPNEANSDKTTGSDGTLSFENLPNGEYMLEETVTPSGYVKQNNNPIYFKIENGTVKWTNAQGAEIEEQPKVTYENSTFTVSNAKGKDLPHTGGMGTTMFYIFGTLLMAGAIGLGAVRRRRSRA